MATLVIAATSQHDLVYVKLSRFVYRHLQVERVQVKLYPFNLHLIFELIMSIVKVHHVPKDGVDWAKFYIFRFF